MDFVKKNQDAFTAGVISLLLGGLAKVAFKKEVIPINTFGKAATTFVIISAAGIGANELKTKYPIGS